MCTVRREEGGEGFPKTMYSWGKKDSTKRYLWSKTILTTGSIGGPGVDPPPRKINSFFLRSMALSVPIYRNFQSNGVKWRSIKLRIIKVMLYAIT